MNILTVNRKRVAKLKVVFIFLQILLVLHTNFLFTPYSFATEHNTEANTEASAIKKAPLILASSGLEEDYQSFLHFSKSFHSFAQEYLNKQHLNTEQLKNQFKIAQDLYFQGKILLAKVQFTNIIKQKWHNDWTAQQKNWIYFSFLRLSQITNNLQKKHTLIKEAIAFVPEKKPNPKVFNPPFLKLYKKLYAGTQWSYITNYLKLQNYKKIIINGKVFNIKPNMKIPIDASQQFKLSLLSNRSDIYSEIMTYSSFSSNNFLQKPLVTGTCKKFKNHNNYKYSIFFTNTCIKNTKKLSTNITAPKINLFPKQSLTPLKHKKKKSKTLKNQTWVLIALAIIGSAIITSQFINQPSRKNGFED